MLRNPEAAAHAIRIEWRRFRCHSDDDGFCLPVNVDKPALNAEGHQHPATAVDEIPLAAVIAFRKSRPSGRPSFVLVDFLLGALLWRLTAAGDHFSASLEFEP
jgi:hypothetical protein